MKFLFLSLSLSTTICVTTASKRRKSLRSSSQHEAHIVSWLVVVVVGRRRGNAVTNRKSISFRLLVALIRVFSIVSRPMVFHRLNPLPLSTQRRRRRRGLLRNGLLLKCHLALGQRPISSFTNHNYSSLHSHVRRFFFSLPRYLLTNNNHKCNNNKIRRRAAFRRRKWLVN